jgi:hypothetical protein
MGEEKKRPSLLERLRARRVAKKRKVLEDEYRKLLEETVKDLSEEEKREMGITTSWPFFFARLTKRRLTAFLIAWTLFIAFVANEFLFVSLKPACAWLAAWAQHGFWQRVLAVAGTAVVTADLYWLRKKRPLHYGTLEIGFGLAVAWYVLGQTLPVLATMGALLSAMFVIIRGLDNVARFWEEMRKSWEVAFEKKQRLHDLLHERPDLAAALRQPDFLTSIINAAIANKMKKGEDLEHELKNAAVPELPATEIAAAPTTALPTRVAPIANEAEPETVGVIGELINDEPQSSVKKKTG